MRGYGRMKLFKRVIDFNLFGVRVFVKFSTYRYWYKRGEKREPEPEPEIDLNQMNLFTDISESQKDIPPEFGQALNDNLWDLV